MDPVIFETAHFFSPDWWECELERFLRTNVAMD